MLEIVDKTSKSMTNEILKTLRTNNLNLQNLVFQSYDLRKNYLINLMVHNKNMKKKKTKISEANIP